MKIAGVVLAGGQSSRYGQPKMFELIGDQPLYKHSLNALQQNELSPLIVATNASLHPRFSHENVHFIIERQPHEGPLFALQNIMVHFPDVEWFFVVASDMPFMNADFVQTMLSLIDNRFDVILPKQGTRLHPLAAIYRRSALPKVNGLVQQNKRSMKVLLEQLQVCTVPFESDNSTFININTQQDMTQTIERMF